MTIINQAAHTIMETDIRIQGHLEGITFLRALAYAKDLQDAGLLAPDLPKPDAETEFNTFAEWFPVPTDPHNPVVWTKPGGTVMVQRLEPGDLTPAEARSVAYALLAAANLAEKEQK